MTPPSTVFVATFAALMVLYIGLGLRVAWLRIRLRVGIGEGKKPEHRPLRRAIRVHGNFAEWVPVTLFAIYLAEVRGAAPLWISILCGALVLGRIGHALGLTRSIGVSVGRTGGTALTLITLLVASVSAVLG